MMSDLVKEQAATLRFGSWCSTAAASYAANAGYEPQAVRAIGVTRQGFAVTVAYPDARRDLARWRAPG
jgi:hypothetical protein